MKLYQYIELNPVRSGIVKHPKDFIWSSYKTNALSKPSRLIKPHFLYENLGTTIAQRCKTYRRIFFDGLSGDEIHRIRAFS